jgi:hypothetical protein
MPVTIVLSTAYLPPAEYFDGIIKADSVSVEREENYLKQTYRNRCYILSSHGSQLLTVPVCKGSLHKTSVKDIKIDYSKRWQQVHLRAMIASYSSAPYFEYYFGDIEQIISKNHSFLLDLNLELTEALLKMLKIDKKISFTKHFAAPGTIENDFRYSISPKIASEYRVKEYLQVFNSTPVTLQGTSIIDLIFNMGPQSAFHLGKQ